MKIINAGSGKIGYAAGRDRASYNDKAKWLVNELIRLENAALALNLADSAILIEQAVKNINKDLRLAVKGKGVAVNDCLATV